MEHDMAAENEQTIELSFSTKLVIMAILTTTSIIVTIFYLCYVNFKERKPYGLQTILDLVHIDLAYCYTLNLVNIQFGLILGLFVTNMNPYVATMLSWFHACRSYILLLYISVSTAIRYIHIYHPWTLENLNLSDETIRKILYYITLAIAGIASTFLTWSGQNS